MWPWILGVLLLAGITTGVILWVRGLLGDRAALGQRDAALRVSEERIDAMEKAAADARAERAEEFAREAREARTADDAARLLREQLARARRPR